jgi:hypothetical protein
MQVLRKKHAGIHISGMQKVIRTIQKTTENTEGEEMPMNMIRDKLELQSKNATKYLSRSCKSDVNKQDPG